MFKFFILIFLFVAKTLVFSNDSSILFSFLKEKIEQSKVQTQPFPFIIIEDFLPESLLEDALRFFPKIDQVKNYGFPICGADGRWCLPINTINEELSGINASFWVNFNDTISNLGPIIANKFLDFIDIKFQLIDQDEIENIRKSIKFSNCTAQGVLYCQSQGKLTPHFDPLKKFVQLMLYLPDDDVHEKYGTKLFYGSPGKDFNNKHLHNNDLVEARILPFRKNTLVLLMQSPLSWHSAEGYEDENYIRKAYFTSINLDTDSTDQYYPGMMVD